MDKILDLISEIMTKQISPLTKSYELQKTKFQNQLHRYRKPTVVCLVVYSTVQYYPLPEDAGSGIK